MGTVERPEQKLSAKDYALCDTRNENAELKFQIKRLEEELQIRHGEIKSLRQALASQDENSTRQQEELIASRESYETEIQTLRAKEQSLRDFVLDSNGDQVVSGDDIISRFASLRQKIQKLATSKTYRLGRENLALWVKDGSIDATLSKLWDKSPRPSRLLILRSLLFQLLNNYILGCETFDINDASLQEISDLSNALGRFERTIVNQGVPGDVVVNWRLSTFKCIEKAQLSGKDFGRDLQTQMYEGFAHLMAEDAAETDKTKLKDGYLELVKEAWNLQLLMRKSRDHYQCWSVNRPSLKSLEPWNEVFEEISDVGTGEDIAFTLFGALVKHSRILGEEPKVMEKAQIIAVTKQV
ncbi:hypothetical protein TrVGV298_010822 [Trichoderma virens]|nr:hypothetical protein TrVGV298_010822 [Trichoderma virens]